VASVSDPRDSREGAPDVDDLDDVHDAEPEYFPDTGWRSFLRSGRFAALLVVGCILGLLAIYTAHPFGSSVSERVSAKLGHPATCENVGKAAIGGQRPTVWRCEIDAGTGSFTQCFTIMRGAVNQFSGARELGC
jgi:hypothetical protein